MSTGSQRPITKLAGTHRDEGGRRSGRSIVVASSGGHNDDTGEQSEEGKAKSMGEGEEHRRSFKLGPRGGLVHEELNLHCLLAVRKL